VTFACEQHHVMRMGLRDGACNGLGPIRNHPRVRGVTQARQHLLQDGLGLFTARVVAGQHHALGELFSRCSHQGALGRVAVTAATYHANERTSTRLRQWQQSLNGLRDGIGGMRVVHHHQGFAGLTHGLHAAWHRRQVMASMNGIGQAVTHRAQTGNHTQHIAHVVLTHHLRVEWMRCIALNHVKTQTTRAMLNVFCLNVRTIPANHLCLVLEEDGLLFSGDHVLNGSTTVIDPPDGHMSDYLDSLDKLLSACAQDHIEFILPAHGYVLGNLWGEPHDARACIQHLKAHRLKREAKIWGVMQQHPEASMDDWVQLAYDDVPPRLWPVAMRSLLAHVERLRSLV
jgi:hypothetical protein